MPLKIRKDLFSEKYRENVEQENVAIFAVPAQVKAENGFVKLTMKQKKIEIKEKGKDNRTFSNDMKDACKVKCKICEKEVVMSSISHHTRSVHCLLLTEYKGIYGDHKETILKKIYHKCGLCKEVLLLDVLEISVHLKRSKHEISHKEYNARFMIYKVIHNSFKMKHDYSVKSIKVEESLSKGAYKKKELKHLTTQQLLEEIDMVLGA